MKEKRSDIWQELDLSPILGESFVICSNTHWGVFVLVSNSTIKLSKFLVLFTAGRPNKEALCTFFSDFLTCPAIHCPLAYCYSHFEEIKKPFQRRQVWKTGLCELSEMRRDCWVFLTKVKRHLQLKFKQYKEACQVLPRPKKLPKFSLSLARITWASEPIQVYFSLYCVSKQIHNFST